MKIPIVVVAYNRPRSLSRLLQSLSEAKYSGQDIDLIISIDRADNNQDVLKIANDFEWKHGSKKVVYQEINLGLRKHILKCGNLSLEYGSVIVLEDDLFVSPNFYLFAEQALDFSSKQSKIGGISLYNHQLNVHTRDNFKALEDGYDNWYFQFASSWGQAWTKNQWQAFMHWYDKNPDIDEIEEVPSYVRSWSPKSWLKYNIAYLIEKELYFLYPKVALTTNFSDAGTHVGNDSTIYQVPLDYAEEKKYSFSNPKEALAVYDAFYENKTLHIALGLKESEVCVDLFGYKNCLDKRYVLTSKIMDYEIVRSYGKSLKPHEDNILRQINGNDFFLYDTTIKEENPNKLDWERKFIYNYKRIGYKSTKKLFIRQTFEKIGNLRKKIIGN
ncbi:glycosyltransferase family 2 protein [Muricauda sp. JGD-17]|uniref:Glycosyltransferase family 2 protein n=1 Tax=Flagellimonas ochracea TaxID=2696472 RepID=A0A964TCZ8_9FLAO|nr:glycosyltransferase family 2 protein [Allomuricauda ochracea]NAY91231.1 glycosyltransferase family 2 protein [Allomuricauda ochracea]